MTVLNTAVADQLPNSRRPSTPRVGKGEPKEQAILSVLKAYVRESAAVHFDGNGYTDEWKEEA